jgi:hypothetical protein
MALLGACRIHGNLAMAKQIKGLKLLLLCYQTSMLLPATCIFMRMLNGKERKKLQRNSWVALGLK